MPVLNWRVEIPEYFEYKAFFRSRSDADVVGPYIYAREQKHNIDFFILYLWNQLKESKKLSQSWLINSARADLCDLDF